MAHRFDFSSGPAVADFGCGPGLYTSRFHEEGARVTGIDFSSRSLDYARSKIPAGGRTISYIEGNYLDAEIEGPFDLITLIYCDFCALNPLQRSDLLKRFRRLLAEDGRILLDVWTMRAYEGRTESADFASGLSGGFWAPGEYIGFSRTWKYDGEAVVLDKYDIIEAHRSRSVYNWLQYYTRESLKAEFEGAGLGILEWFGDVAGTPPGDEDDVFAVIAGKAG